MKAKINNQGLSLIEAIVVIAIFSLVSIGLFNVFATGRSTWFNTDASMELQWNLRSTLAKISQELHQSGFDKNGVSQVGIGDGMGINATDILRFSIPVLCQTGMNILDSNGDVAYWGAPLTWGCDSSTCMDADNDCSTVDYKYIEYLIDDSTQLIRRVLDDSFTIVRQDIFASHITDFQINSSLDGKLISFQIAAQRTSASQRLITATSNMDVALRN